MNVSRKSPLVGAAMAVSLVVAAAGAAWGAGHVQTVVGFDPEMGQLSEGVAVAADGSVYASLSPLGQLVRVDIASGEFEIVGNIEGIAEGDFGLIGVTTGEFDPENVYGAVFSSNPDATGVWRFDIAAGTAARLTGTEEIALANDVAFGEDGTLYISDSIAGAVWRLAPGSGPEPWIVDPLLAGTGEAGFPFPIGANGIDVHDGTVYVGVTETAQVVGVPINDDGSPGPAETLAQYPAPIDGVEVAADGTIYTTHPIDNLVGKLVPGGEVEIIAEEADGLDAPSSVAVLQDDDGGVTAYVANFSVAMGGPLGAGPSILALDD